MFNDYTWGKWYGKLLFLACKIFSLTHSRLKLFSTLHVVVAKWPSSGQWNVSRSVMWQLLELSSREGWHMPFDSSLGPVSHHPVWNMDASSHAVSKSQCGILGLVMAGHYWHPQPGTKEMSGHWHLEEEGCVERAIHQEPYEGEHQSACREIAKGLNIWPHFPASSSQCSP